jgi:hypothetical protein
MLDGIGISQPSQKRCVGPFGILALVFCQIYIRSFRHVPIALSVVYLYLLKIRQDCCIKRYFKNQKTPERSREVLFKL